MYTLKTDCKLLVQGLGIYLTKDSTQEEFASALKHSPKLSNFIETKGKNNGEVKTKQS